MGESTGGWSSGAGGGGVAGVGMNRGTQKDLQGKRQVNLDSSLSRRTRTLHRPQRGGRGHFNQEMGVEAAIPPVCWKESLVEKE